MRADRGFVLLLAAAALVILTLTQSSLLLTAAPALIASPFEQVWNLCMNAIGLMRSHALYLSVTAPVATFVAIAVPGLASATRQVWRTRVLMRNVLRNQISRLPAPLARLAVKVGLEGRVRFVDSPHFYAFCFGWLRPEICISSGATTDLSAEELEALLRHEAYHLHRRDPLRRLLGDSVGDAFFFLPVIRELARFCVLRRELRADLSAVQGMGDTYALAGALYKAVGSPAGHLGPDTAVAAFSVVDARIDQIASLGGSAPGFRPHSSSIILSLLSLLAITAVVCLLAASWQIGGGAPVCPSC